MNYERRGRYIVRTNATAAPRDGTRNGVTYMPGKNGTTILRVGADFGRAIAEQTPEADPTVDLKRELQAQRARPK